MNLLKKIKLNFNEGNFGLFQIYRNISWLVFDKVVKALSVLLIGAWVARYFSPNNFGYLTYILAYLDFFQAIARLLSFGLAIIWQVYKNGFNSRAVNLTFLCGGIIIFQAFDIIDIWLQVQRQNSRTVRVKLLAYILSILLKIILIKKYHITRSRQIKFTRKIIEL